MYDNKFFAHIQDGSRRSAAIVVPIINRLLQPKSVLDFGCGQGLWLAEWMKLGIHDIHGVDGDYVYQSELAIPREKFIPFDSEKPLKTGRRYDLITSLEVGEHLPATAAESFVESLCLHGDIVVFSAAVPGQGGNNHINEQPHSYWRDLFANIGYACCDLFRPQLRRLTAIEPWYRHNILVFVKSEQLRTMTEAIRMSALPENESVPNPAGLCWRMRCAFLRRVPNPILRALLNMTVTH